MAMGGNNGRSQRTLLLRIFIVIHGAVVQAAAMVAAFVALGAIWLDAKSKGTLDVSSSLPTIVMIVLVITLVAGGFLSFRLGCGTSVLVGLLVTAVQCFWYFASQLPISLDVVSSLTMAAGGFIFAGGLFERVGWWGLALSLLVGTLLTDGWTDPIAAGELDWLDAAAALLLPWGLILLLALSAFNVWLSFSFRPLQSQRYFGGTVDV